MTAADAENFLYAQIPLAKAMGVRVVAANADRVVLSAPLDANHNHLGTAFGGSLNAVAVLAGYAFLWLRLGDRDAHVVVRRSSIDYRRPVTGEIRAVCIAPDEAAIAAFQTRFAQKGKARITLDVTIEEAGAVCVTFQGEYVALR
jgi:thioesterase domain-containing protein